MELSTAGINLLGINFFTGLLTPNADGPSNENLFGLPSTNKPAGRRSLEKQGLLFYKESDRGPLQANFVEVDIDNSLTIAGNMQKLNPARDTGTLIYLSNVKWPMIWDKLLFENQFLSTNAYGGMIRVQETLAVVAVSLVFAGGEYQGNSSHDFFEHPVVYKGKTQLTHARSKPSQWGALEKIAVIDLNS
jgi:hypothetical protein